MDTDPTRQVRLSELLGRPSPLGEGVAGRLDDLVVDVSAGLAHVPVTHVVVRHGRRREVLALSGPGGPPGASSLRLRRDVLDVVAVDLLHHRRCRVGDVVLDVAGETWRVAGLELRPRAALTRLLRRPGGPVGELVDLPDVHLASRAAHAAHLRAVDSGARTADPTTLAHLLTRLPVTAAREVLRTRADPSATDAVGLLHPHVRDRVLDTVDRRTRRSRRLHGWRLHPPGGGR